MEHLSESGGTPEVKPSPKKETGSSTSNGSSGGGGEKIKSSKGTNRPSGEAYTSQDSQNMGLAEIRNHLYKAIAYMYMYLLTFLGNHIKIDNNASHIILILVTVSLQNMH